MKRQAKYDGIGGHNGVDCLMILLIITLSTACGEPFSNHIFEEDIAFLEALPKAEQLEVEVPESSSEAARSSVCTASTNPEEDCDPDAFRQWSVDMADTVNSYVLGILEILDRIRSNPPTERDENSRIWGPWLIEDYQIYGRLEIIRDDPTYSYELSLSYAPDEAGDVLLSGFYWPGSVAEEGQGAFVFDFSVQSEYSPDHNRVGRMDVVYDTRGDVLDMELEGHDLGDTDSEERADPSYAYYSGEDNTRYFYYSQLADVTGSSGAEESVSFWSVWEADGWGRADIKVQGGDLGLQVASGVECWNPEQTPEFFYTPWCGANGDSSLCVASAEDWNAEDWNAEDSTQ